LDRTEYGSKYNNWEDAFMKKGRKVLAYAVTAVLTAGMFVGLQRNVQIARAETCGGITVSGGTKGTDYEYDESTGKITVKTGTELTFSTSSLFNHESSQIYVESGVNANLVLNGLVAGRFAKTQNFTVNELSKFKPLIEIADDSNGCVTISIKGDNKLIGNVAPAIQKNGSSGTLLIQGDGVLTVNQFSFFGNANNPKNNNHYQYAGAAIGSAYQKEVSGIEIRSGTVKATTYSGGAAIGSGYAGTVKNITISGGTVEAVNQSYQEGNTFGASIGSGAGYFSTADGAPNNVENITISGGTVTAESTFASAIGAGNHGSAKNITISGGTVSASTSGVSASAIGSGVYGNATGIVISGGKIKATATGANGAGIGNGGGIEKDMYGTNVIVTTDITITGGTVVAIGGQNAPGIGAAYGSNASVYISGGSVNASSAGNTADAIGLSNFAKTNSDAGYQRIFQTSTTDTTVPKLVTCQGSNPNTRVSLTLTKEGTDYTGYGMKDIFTDDSNKIYLYLPEGVEASIAEPDTQPPVVSNVSLRAADSSSATVEFTIADNKSTSCDYAYVVLPSNQSNIPKDFATIKAASGAITGTGIGKITAKVGNLIPGQSYIVYVAADDKNGNAMNTVAKSSVLSMGKAGLIVEQAPTFTGVYGTKLSAMKVSSNGRVTYNDTVVEGTWSLSGNEVPSAGTVSCTATFTPKETSKYDSVSSEATVTVNARALSNVTMSLIASQIYTGSAITPSVNVTDSGAAITSDDYTIGYSDNTNAGTATVTITGKGNYTGTKTAKFQITAASILDATVSPISAQAYTGSAIVPPVTITYNGKQLTSDDYTIKCTDNIDVGMATVTITGKGNYTESRQESFKITTADISNANVEIADQTYTGSALKPSVKITVNGTELTSSDYDISYENNTNAGTAEVTIVGKGNYTGEKKAEFKINKAPGTASNQTMYVVKGSSQTSYEYDMTKLIGSSVNQEQMGEISYIVDKGNGDIVSSVSNNGNILNLILNSNLENIGTQAVQVTISSSNYEDIIATLTIRVTDKKALTLSGVSIPTNAVYNGLAQGYTGTFKWLENGTDRTESVNTTVTYKGTTAANSAYDSSDAPTEAGSYTVTFTVDDNNDYIGTESYSYAIAKQTIDVSTLSWIDTKEFTYDGQSHSVTLKSCPDTVTCTYSGNTEINAKDGYYTATADIAAKDAANYQVINSVEPCRWRINKASYNMSNVKWDYEGAFTENGSQHSVSVTGCPSGVTPHYTGTHQASEAGTYEAGVYFTVEDSDNYNIPASIGSCMWQIIDSSTPVVKKDYDMSNVKWNYATPFTYDGKQHSVAVTGCPSGVTPEYSGTCKATDVGIYKAVVNFKIADETQYNVPDSMTLEWKIVKASSGGDNPGGGTSDPEDEKKYIPAVGTEETVNGMKYVVTEADVSGGTVKYAGPTQKSVTSVKIPETVAITTAGKTKNYKITTITADAFKSCNSLKSIVIGNNVTTIESNAFSGLKKLKTVTFGNKVTTIGKNAFKNCKALTTVKLPNSVKSVGSNAFSGCKALKTVKTGNGLTSIATGTFNGCSKLSSVTMGSKVKKIGDKAFYKCTALKKITIPKKVTTIGKQSFYGCKKLANITLKTSSLKKVGSKAIKGINKKAKIKCPSKKVSKYKKLFKKSTGYVKTMKIKK